MTDYSKFDKLEDYEPDEDEEDWKLTEAELKAKREKKRDELIQKELDSYKKMDELLEKAAKQPRKEAKDYKPLKPLAWSEGRETHKVERSLEEVDAMLAHLAKDDEFQKDLWRPSFQKALKHWTQQERLPTDDPLWESYEFRQYVQPGFEKITRLQGACRRAGIGVPLDALLAKRSTVFLTQQEKDQIEKERKKKARDDFEKRMMDSLPPPEPFSWKKFGRQIAIQMVVMVAAMLYFRYFISPQLEEDLATSSADDLATSSADAPPDDDDFLGLGESPAEL